MGLLEIRNLSIAFRRPQGLWRQGTIQCLADVDLAARKGEVLALVGSSGAGKSLLAHAVLGILPPNAIISGEMRLDGMLLDEAGKARLRGQRLALIPQSITHLDPLAPVGRQLVWAARRAGQGPILPVEALRAVGLPVETAGLYPGAMSGGMARRALLAAALASPADTLLADEPTNGLDPENAKLVLFRLRGLADIGRTVVVITHDLMAVLPFADRVLVMRGGQVMGDEAAANFTGSGERLRGEYSRRLWRALPQNNFDDTREELRLV